MAASKAKVRLTAKQIEGYGAMAGAPPPKPTVSLPSSAIVGLGSTAGVPVPPAFKIGSGVVGMTGSPAGAGSGSGAPSPSLIAPNIGGALMGPRISPEDPEYNAELANNFNIRDTGLAKDTAADKTAGDNYDLAVKRLADQYAMTKDNTINRFNAQGLFYSGQLGKQQGVDETNFNNANTGALNTKQGILDQDAIDAAGLQRTYGVVGKMVKDPYTGLMVPDTGTQGGLSLANAIGRQTAADAAAAAGGTLANTGGPGGEVPPAASPTAPKPSAPKAKVAAKLTRPRGRSYPGGSHRIINGKVYGSPI